MTSIKIWIGEPKQKEFIIYGKKRIIRDIRVNEPDEFEAYYKGWLIRVYIDDQNRCSAICRNGGGAIVDGFLGEDHWSNKKKLSYGIKECLENIFYPE